jgi:hypothetical protein
MARLHQSNLPAAVAVRLEEIVRTCLGFFAQSDKKAYFRV